MQLCDSSDLDELEAVMFFSPHPYSATAKSVIMQNEEYFVVRVILSPFIGSIFINALSQQPIHICKSSANRNTG